MQLDKQRVQRQFSRAASSYNRVAGMQREIVSELLDMIPVTAFEANSIADLGCGTGYGLQGLISRCPNSHLVGLDLASGMLGQAQQIQPAVSYVQGDIEALPLATAQFGLSFSSSAIQWCQLQSALAELVRVIEPGGWLALSTFVDGTLDSWRNFWAINEVHRFVSPDEIRNCLDDARMTNLKVVVKTYQQHFYSFFEATASIRDLGAASASAHRPRGLMGRRRYIQIKKQIEELIVREGSITLPYKVAFIVARKPMSEE